MLMSDHKSMTDRADTLLLLEVMHRHRLGVGEVADLSGHHHSYISRVCSGQHPVPAELLRRLYRRTQDLAIGEYLFGDALVLTNRPLSVAASQDPAAGDRPSAESTLGLLMHAAARLVAEASALIRVSGRDEIRRLAVRAAMSEVLSLAMRLSEPAPGAAACDGHLRLSRLQVTA